FLLIGVLKLLDPLYRFAILTFLTPANPEQSISLVFVHGCHGTPTHRCDCRPSDRGLRTIFYTTLDSRARIDVAKIVNWNASEMCKLLILLNNLFSAIPCARRSPFSKPSSDGGRGALAPRRKQAKSTLPPVLTQLLSAQPPDRCPQNHIAAGLAASADRAP